MSTVICQAHSEIRWEESTRTEDPGRAGNKPAGSGPLEAGDWTSDADPELLSSRAKKQTPSVRSSS